MGYELVRRVAREAADLFDTLIDVLEYIEPRAESYQRPREQAFHQCPARTAFTGV